MGCTKQLMLIIISTGIKKGLFAHCINNLKNESKNTPPLKGILLRIMYIMLNKVLIMTCNLLMLSAIKHNSYIT